MAMQSTTNPADVADRLQTHFSKKLLAHAVNTLRLNEFAMQADLPAKAGSATIRFFRRRAAKRDDIVGLTEGTPITTFTEVTFEKVDVTLAQRGEAAKITDVLRMIDMYEPLQQNIQAMGEDAALDFDTITRNAIVTGLDDSNGNQERFAGVANTGNSANDFASLAGETAQNAKLTRARALACVTQLKVNNTPRASGGGYICIIPPQIAHDLMQDDDWVEAAKYSNVQALYKGEIGMLDGVRYVEATNPFIEDAVYGTYNSAGAIYSAIFTGKDAYGCAKLAGTGSPYKPRVIIVDKADKSDPLNQFITAGWKAFYNSLLLNANFLVLFRAKSTFN